MIYSHKPQRSGRSIQANTNNPPQDPPKINVVTEPDILIEDTTPPVPEICIEKELELPKPVKKLISKKIIPKKTKKTLPKKTIPKPVSPQAEVTPKISLFRRFIVKIKIFFGRN